jgi:hypothetical protein
LMLFVKKPTPPMIIKIKMLNRVGIKGTCKLNPEC